MTASVSSSAVAADSGGRSGGATVDEEAKMNTSTATVDEEAFIRWWTSAGGGVSTLVAAPDHMDKFGTFKFGSSEAFAGGLMSFIGANELVHSIEQECRDNGDGEYYKEYTYVVQTVACEQFETDSATGAVRVRDKGHTGMDLESFTKQVQEYCPKIKKAHVAVLRLVICYDLSAGPFLITRLLCDFVQLRTTSLYTDKLYRPWNGALRALVDANNEVEAKRDPAKKELLKWATCISVLYEALIILSFETKEDLTAW
jgi:hypothetical protein